MVAVAMNLNADTVYWRGEGKMASSAQMKLLLKSHCIGDEERFNTSALRIAAAETQQEGHQKFADEGKNLIINVRKEHIANANTQI